MPVKLISHCLSIMQPTCNHHLLNFEVSIHANEIGFRRPTAQQRAAAAGKRYHTTEEGIEGTFPAPLVLPGDDLSMDTRCPPQSLLSWVREKERNEVTPERRVVYVARCPEIEPQVRVIRSWSDPQVKGAMGTASAYTTSANLPLPNVIHVLDYLKAFYHGVDVRFTSAGSLQFTDWDDTDPKSCELQSKSRKVKYIGLSTSTEIIGIRTRPSKDGIFKVQLNLDDLLDTAISILPDDAYALLMLVDYDLYENEEDDFCCGE